MLFVFLLFVIGLRLVDRCLLCVVCLVCVCCVLFVVSRLLYAVRYCVLLVGCCWRVDCCALCVAPCVLFVVR